MGGSKQSAQPQIPNALKGLYKMGASELGQLRGLFTDQNWNQRFGDLDPNISPDAAELAAQQRAMQIFGGDDFANIQRGVGDLARTGGWEDLEPYMRDVQTRELETGASQIGERFSRLGLSRSSGTANAISTYQGDLSRKLVLDLAAQKQMSYDRRLNASALYGQLGQAGAGTLATIGAQMRGIREANYARDYQSRMTPLQMRLALAQAAFGGASSAPLWQPTYGPGMGANVLGGMAAGAGAGAAFGPWGALAGGVIGGGAAYFGSR